MTITIQIIGANIPDTVTTLICSQPLISPITFPKYLLGQTQSPRNPWSKGREGRQVSTSPTQPKSHPDISLESAYKIKDNGHQPKTLIV
jgi:hypothetical protein